MQASQIRIEDHQSKRKAATDSQRKTLKS